MPNVFEFDGVRPVIHPSAFVHPNATVTGQVTIGRDVYIGPGAAIRGDWGAIEIGDGCNVQENCVIHVFPGVTVVLEDAAHIGHGAIIHGARISRLAKKSHPRRRFGSARLTAWPCPTALVDLLTFPTSRTALELRSGVPALA
jgi:serine acetyltransferase